MAYVDGFVLLVPKKNLTKYTKMAKEAGEIWKKHGAVAYMECTGDEMKPMGCELTFPTLTKAKPNETVLFSFIIYKNKSDRTKINKKVMKEMCELYDEDSAKMMPFDMNKMAVGGFKSIVDLQ